ncbi:insect allergen related repeat, nitrile-specifier detoxification domain-containing protein [Phthorimaea operculella]|nr:insect allergen related repeat, nitrile-specifier detoxification domain-containing protein [Phthorimaea operculella]
MRLKHFTVLFAIVTISYGAPHKKKKFHEHLEDFVGLILAESGLQIELLLKQYGESKEFGIAATYLRTTHFRDVLKEVESLPEFKAMTDYLERAQIDIKHILEYINELVEQNENVSVKPKRHKDGEMDLTNFIQESMNLYPKEKLKELFQQKEREYPRFKYSVDKLKTEEWEHLYQALWESQGFKKASNTLAENGLDVRLLVDSIKALFGQN